MSSYIPSFSYSSTKSVLLHSTGDFLNDWFTRITNKKGSLFYDEKSCKNELNMFEQELKSLNNSKDLIKTAPRVAAILFKSVTGNHDPEIINICLEFFHNHPYETLIPESLEKLARAFEHSAHWVKDHFETIFNFMKATPIVFREERVLRSLAEVLSGSAFWMCHSLPSFDSDRSEAQAKKHFELVKNYIVANGLQANPIFQEELEALIARNQDSIVHRIDDETRLVRRAYIIEQLAPLRIQRATTSLDSLVLL